MKEYLKKFFENQIAVAIFFSAIILTVGIISYAFINSNKNQNSSKEILDEIINKDKYFAGRDFQNNEYLIGDNKDKINLVLYNDFECPFCIRFQNETVEKLVEKYKDKNVGIVYRHFAQSYHLKAIPEINASFCVRENYGQESYVNFIFEIYKNTNGNDDLDLSLLPKIAEDSVKKSKNIKKEFNKEEFLNCSNTLKYKNLIEADQEDAITAGLDGTPYSIITFKDEKGKILIISKISGAREISYFEKIIDELLKIK